MKRRRLVPLLFLAAACGPDAAALRTALLDADREFARESQVRRLDAWLDAVGDTGVVLRGSGSAARGPAGVRDRFAPLFADSAYTLTWEPLYAEISASGDLGYTVGLSQTGRRGPAGQPAITAGKYVTVWRKDAKGVWRVAVQAGVAE